MPATWTTEDFRRVFAHFADALALLESPEMLQEDGVRELFLAEWTEARAAFSRIHDGVCN